MRPRAMVLIALCAGALWPLLSVALVQAIFFLVFAKGLRVVGLRTNDDLEVVETPLPADADVPAAA
jgi:hypothetical protein